MGTDEGRAIAQLVHDIAPGADLQFHTAFADIPDLGIANFAQGILDLRAAGSDIIVDDVRYLAEPIFSDGVIAQAVDQVVEDGALYFSAAGNLGRLGYDSAFRNSGISIQYLREDEIVNGFAHDFDPDPDSTVTTQRITLAPSLVPENPTAFTMSFQWDDPFFSNTGGQAANDTEMDVIFRIANGADFGLPNGAIVGGSAANNLATGDPVEIAGIANPFDAELQIDVQLLFRDDPANNEPGRLVYQLFDNGTVTIDTFDTASGTASGHAAARGAIATGASFFPLNSAGDFEASFGFPPEAIGIVVPAINFFSSAGPQEILFDAAGNRLDAPELRNTPQITSADGTSTTVPGFETFFGTSAAVANAAGVAALMVQFVDGLERTEALTALEETASDVISREGFLFSRPDLDAVLPRGADFDSGAGVIQADAALQFLEEINDLGRKDQKIIGSFDDDRIEGGDGADRLFGSYGDDRIEGGDRGDYLFGNEGDDWLFGEDGRDLLSGGAGNDGLSGGDGWDHLRGGIGDDLLRGGDGWDSPVSYTHLTLPTILRV